MLDYLLCLFLAFKDGVVIVSFRRNVISYSEDFILDSGDLFKILLILTEFISKIFYILLKIFDLFA